MVEISLQTDSNTEINSRDLSLLMNNTFTNKTSLEYVNCYLNDREMIDIDPSIVSIGRSTNYQRLGCDCDYYHSSDEQYDEITYKSNDLCQIHCNDQHQINVVDQMISQPHVPYALLPKHFKPKQISCNQNQQESHLLINNTNMNNTRHSQQENYFKGYNKSYRSMIHRQYFMPTKFYYKSHINDCYNSYPYQLIPNRSYVSFKTIPSYGINKWRNSYPQSKQSLYFQQQHGEFQLNDNRNCIRDDHRINTSS